MIVKKFNESIKDEPQINDFVIIKPHNLEYDYDDFDVYKFNIGQIVNITFDNETGNNEYRIIYNIKNNRKIFTFLEDEILYHSKNKEDVELYIQALKYNL